MTKTHLTDILEKAAATDAASGIAIYRPGNVESAHRLTYAELRDTAQQNARLLGMTAGFTPGSLVLLHLDDHRDNMIWLWSLIYAGCIPVMSTPFAHHEEHRRSHLLHLRSLLRDPICLTRRDLEAQFPQDAVLRLCNVESIGKNPNPDRVPQSGPSSAGTDGNDDDIALLMLTSGSTGHAKAVPLTHHQLLSALAGKEGFLQLCGSGPSINWVAFDHIASLAEMHFHPMFACIDQVHVAAADIITDPLVLLELIHRHRAGVAFAPNFLLGRLLNYLEQEQPHPDRPLDLSCLKHILSGGEANVVDSCARLARRLTDDYGAPSTCIKPGFGMTETCAGCSYNDRFPTYEANHALEFASLGRGMEGVQMRVTSLSTGQPVDDHSKVGNLELCGPSVCRGYYNNPQATRDSFTSDGWFRTGDLASIDAGGQLILRGRSKELICINGVKYLPHEVESAIEDAKVPGVTPGFTVSFGYRPPKAQTESLAVVYLPAYDEDDVESRFQAQNAIIRVGLIMTGTRPYVLPLDARFLVKSSLGKISRNKIKTGLETGAFQALEKTNHRFLKARQSAQVVAAETETETLLLRAACRALPVSADEFGVETPIFSLGITSMDMISWKKHAEAALGLEIPMLAVMTSPTIRALAHHLLGAHHCPSEYNPVVTLQPHGSKTPLWLIHPIGGEVLVFVSLANLFSDRPVHALRARGLNPGESPFSSIDEAAEVYYQAIKRVQPHGPYAITGYSYGSLVAFEVAKRLDQHGTDEVPFFGSLDLPPFHARIISQSDWTESLLHLSSSIALIAEDEMATLGPHLRGLPRDAAIQTILARASPRRVAELDLTASALLQWAELTSAMAQATRGYEPLGETRSVDVFYTEPSGALATSREEWLGRHREWRQFGRLETRFHPLQGLHYRLLDEDNVHGVYRVLSRALHGRGL
nr:non ribosomal peptide synthetase [Aspergillus sp.]